MVISCALIFLLQVVSWPYWLAGCGDEDCWRLCLVVCIGFALKTTSKFMVNIPWILFSLLFRYFYLRYYYASSIHLCSGLGMIWCYVDFTAMVVPYSGFDNNDDCPRSAFIRGGIGRSPWSDFCTLHLQKKYSHTSSTKYWTATWVWSAGLMLVDVIAMLGWHLEMYICNPQTRKVGTLYSPLLVV